MLTECRRGKRRRAGSTRKPDRVLEAAISAYDGMIERCYQVLLQDLRMVEHILDGMHRRIRHAVSEHSCPFQGSPLGQALTQARHQDIGMRDPLLHRVIARVVGELRHSDHLAKRRPEMLRMRRDVDVAVLGRVDPGQRLHDYIAVCVGALTVGPDEATGRHRVCAAKQRGALVLALAVPLALQQGSRYAVRHQRSRVIIDD